MKLRIISQLTAYLFILILILSEGGKVSFTLHKYFSGENVRIDFICCMTDQCAKRKCVSNHLDRNSAVSGYLL